VKRNRGTPLPQTPSRTRNTEPAPRSGPPPGTHHDERSGALALWADARSGVYVFRRPRGSVFLVTPTAFLELGSIMLPAEVASGAVPPEVRTVRMAVRLTRPEMAFVRARARAEGASVSAYVRAVLSAPAPGAVSRPR
jgi:hypothetical protein